MTPSRKVRARKSDAKWRLEAFDLRAGLAFATWRDQQRPAQEVEDWPCLFFSPPSFAPEPIGNVAAALGATRGCFSSGLFVDEQEAFFETPEDVAEFVRRAYIGSAGGDGGDGGGAEGEPLPPTEPPDLPNTDGPMGQSGETPEETAGYALDNAAEQFNFKIEKTPLGLSFVHTWKEAAEASAVDSLSSGALHAMRELLRRYPATGARNAVRWLGDARALGACVTDIGLWPKLFSKPYYRQLSRLVESVRVPVLELRDYRERTLVLFGHGPMLDDEPGIEMFLWYLRHRMPTGQWSADGSTGDPLDLLRRLPLPAFAQPVVAADLADRASLYHLLAAFVAAPQMVQHAKNVIATIDLVLFAAACIVSPRGTPSRHSVDIELSRPSGHVTPMQLEAIQIVGEETLQWLTEHLPDRGFTTKLEERIAGAKNIRYGKTSASGSGTAPSPEGRPAMK